ncbi:MAG: hypothetical protein Q9222_001975 [Ikaeria aurantiellina]
MGGFKAFFNFSDQRDKGKIKHLSLEDGIDKAIALTIARSYYHTKPFYDVILKHLIAGFTIQKVDKGGEEFINIIEKIVNGVQRIRKMGVEDYSTLELKGLVGKVPDAASREGGGDDGDVVVRVWEEWRKENEAAIARIFEWVSTSQFKAWEFLHNTNHEIGLFQEEDNEDLEAQQDFMRFILSLLRDDTKSQIDCSKGSAAELQVHIHNPREDSVTLLLSNEDVLDWDQDQRAEYRNLQNILMEDALGKSIGTVTTHSNAADKDFKMHAHAQCVGNDEAGQSTELEAVLPILANWESADLVILVGDQEQLYRPVFSKNANLDGDLVNPCFKQLHFPLFTGLWRRNLPLFMFHEQYRAAAGLEEVYSRMFYGGKLTDAPSTYNRSEAANSTAWIRETINRHDGIPHVCLNIPSGVCPKKPTKSNSRTNPVNVALGVRYIRKILAVELFPDRGITVIVPYRAQAREYRTILRTLRIHKVNVSTIDAMQSKENQCIIFDFTIAKNRDGGVGFMSERSRPCVALSRAQNFLMILCDKTICQGKRRNDEGLEELNPVERGLVKHLKTAIDYYEAKRVVHYVDPKTFEEKGFPNMSQVENSWSARLGHCHSCGKSGHRAADCPEPADPTRQKPKGLCPNCHSRDHQRDTCPQTQCNRCHWMGHLSNSCPEMECNRCHRKGHMSNICTQPRTCQDCGGPHLKRDYAQPRVPPWQFLRPDVSDPNAAEPVEPAQPVEVPQVSSKWDSLQVDNDLILAAAEETFEEFPAD